MIILRNKLFTSRAFKLVKKSNILKEIGTKENGGGYLGHLKSAAERGRHHNIVAEEAVNLDRKLSKKGIEKTSRELSEAAAVRTQRQLGHGGYAESRVVPKSKPGKNGQYFNADETGDVVDMYKALKNNGMDKEAKKIVDFKKYKKEVKKNPLIDFK